MAHSKRTDSAKNTETELQKLAEALLTERVGALEFAEEESLKLLEKDFHGCSKSLRTSKADDDDVLRGFHAGLRKQRRLLPCEEQGGKSDRVFIRKHASDSVVRFIALCSTGKPMHS